MPDDSVYEDLELIPFLARAHTDRPLDEQADDVVALVNEINRVRQQRDRHYASLIHAAGSAMDHRETSLERREEIARLNQELETTNAEADSASVRVESLKAKNEALRWAAMSFKQRWIYAWQSLVIEFRPFKWGVAVRYTKRGLLVALGLALVAYIAAIAIAAVYAPDASVVATVAKGLLLGTVALALAAVMQNVAIRRVPSLEHNEGSVP